MKQELEGSDGWKESMPELSFAEKLLIARKQLDLFQYEMAERLGVHANSLTKY